MKLNIYKADDSYYQNLLGTSFINPTTGEVVLKGDKVPNPSKPEETTPSEEPTPSEPVEEMTETTTPNEETTTETMEVPTTEKNNLPNTGSQTVNVQPTTVVTPTTAANKPEVVKSTNQVMLPKTGTQSNVSVMVLGFGILGLAFLGLKRQRKMK